MLTSIKAQDTQWDFSGVMRKGQEKFISKIAPIASETLYHSI
jgi:hypothetical protein